MIRAGQTRARQQTNRPAAGPRVSVTMGDNCSRLITVLDIASLSVSDARTSLESAGLKLGNRTESASNFVPIGDAVDQTPPAGSMTPLDLGVDVTVSSRP